MRWTIALGVLGVVPSSCAQQIWDVWDRTAIFTSVGSNPPINFSSPSVIGDADITINDGQVYQSIYGFGGSLSTSLLHLLATSQNSGSYNKLLRYLFDPTDGANAAGLSYVRVPLGASDFSAKIYNLDDVHGDTSFDNFNIDKAPSYLFSVLQDIQAINSNVKVHLVPWSPPGWMKDSGTMKGGSLQSQYLTSYATYLLKGLQGFKNKGINLHAISIQNEPQNNNPTYPTSTLTPAQEAKIGKALRKLMDNNGFSNVELVGYEHNWDDASAYPVTLINDAPNAFAGVAFHCYAGNVAQMDDFHNAHSDKEIYFTECAGTIGSDWWSDIKWYSDNIFIGGVNHNAVSGLMWNIALDGNGEPKLPGTNSCGGSGCRAIVTVNSDGSWSVNQEFYAMAHVSKATIPKDSGGPSGKRIGVTVGGDLSWALVVTAFVTERTNSSDWLRYSLVVLNWRDNSSGSWNPQNVQTTIEFRGQQATYTFPVGVTTLWWYAPANSAKETDEEIRVGDTTTRSREDSFVYEGPQKAFGFV
ncbi:glycoside hydrolase family 30 protein [Schizophyllum commune]